MGGLNGIFGINPNQQMYGASQVNKGFNFGGAQVGGSQGGNGNQGVNGGPNYAQYDTHKSPAVNSEYAPSALGNKFDEMF